VWPAAARARGSFPSRGRSVACPWRCALITPEQHAEIRRLYFGEHWKVGTIVAQLGVHPDTVRAAIALDTRVVRRGACRRSIRDPSLPFIRDTLAQYPRLRATRLYEMLRPRGSARVFRISKMRSCLRMSVALGTSSSLAIVVSSALFGIAESAILTRVAPSSSRDVCALA